MEVLRSVMFGLLTVSLILGITALPVDQSQTQRNLSRLLSGAETDANRTFRNNCQNEAGCAVPSPFDPPIFQAGNKNTEELFQEMYSVCIGFTDMLQLFLDDIKGQPNYSSKLSKDLENLINISLGSVESFLQEQKPDVQDLPKTVNICTSEDVSLRNTKNLQTVERMGIEMYIMSKVFP